MDGDDFAGMGSLAGVTLAVLLCVGWIEDFGDCAAFAVSAEFIVFRGGGPEDAVPTADGAWGFSEVEEVFRNFSPSNGSLSFPFLRFLEPLAIHCSSSIIAALEPDWSSSAAFSASSRCFRKMSSFSVVSLRMAASAARVDSRTESRNSTSSSSRARNWFLSLWASSKASCFAT